MACKHVFNESTGKWELVEIDYRKMSDEECNRDYYAQEYASEVLISHYLKYGRKSRNAGFMTQPQLKEVDGKWFWIDDGKLYVDPVLRT